MSEDQDNENQDDEDHDDENLDIEKQDKDDQSFAELFESYSSGMKDDLKIGERIKGKIISIGNDSVFMDTGTKIDGTVDRIELLDGDGNMPYKEGDEIELYVVAIDDHEVRLSKAISGVGGLELLKNAFENTIPVEGKISATCKGGFHVEMLQRRAFCPISQIDVNYTETPEDYVGQTFQFLITQFGEGGRNIIVSRRKLLAKAIEKEKEAFFSTLKAGDIFNGRVTRIMPYGAFVELISGVEGMVHISELSWSRAEKAEEIVSADDTVTVKVISVADGEKKNQKKISLSMKQIDTNPWDKAADNFHPGDKVSGKVTRCMAFGVFVEIAPGIEGLVHISEMSYLKRVINPADVVKAGETVSVVIKEVDAKARRISLSIRDALGDPWLEVAEKFSVGQVIIGTVEKKEKFGYFITLAPGITGLLPKSKFSGAEKPGLIEQLKAGDPVAVTLEEIHSSDRKITLAPGDAKEEGAWKNFAETANRAPVSDLAEKLRLAMESKKRK
ncbi:MAG: 30S ribosomal protein S1 [Desulfobacteraceae bacterium]|nr:MAG: 30S ribosomal protein S1 [Desulfobacteraceae bacterium]